MNTPLTPEDWAALLEDEAEFLEDWTTTRRAMHARATLLRELAGRVREATKEKGCPREACFGLLVPVNAAWTCCNACDLLVRLTP